MTEIRDHVTKIGLNQGSNGKKMLKPGTIAPLMQSLSCILLSGSPCEYSRLTMWSYSESLSKLCFPIYLAHFLCKYEIIICVVTIQINFVRHLVCVCVCVHARVCCVCTCACVCVWVGVCVIKSFLR